MVSVETFSVTPFEQNARLITNRELKRSLLVDPGGDVEKFLRPGLGLEAILLTHCHIDHCGGVARTLRMLAEWGEQAPPIYAGSESELRQSIVLQGAYFGLSPGELENCPEPDILLQPGMTLRLLDTDWEARFTPGHSPGHFSFVTPEISFELSEFGRRFSGSGRLLFAGDALFQGSIGRTDLPGGDFDQLISSIRNELLTLPGDTLVLSGHGPLTTIERERRQNPFLQGE